MSTLITYFSVSVDAKAQTDNYEERGSRKDKFATERQRITAPEPSREFLIKFLQSKMFLSFLISDNEKANNKNSLKTRGFNNNRSRGRGWGRGGRYQQNNNQSRIYPVNQGMQYNQGNPPGRNKTVLINPRFQGVVHVNNNGNFLLHFLGFTLTQLIINFNDKETCEFCGNVMYFFSTFSMGCSMPKLPIKQLVAQSSNE